MKTEAISMWAENEGDTGRTVWAWSYTLNDEDFGGYGANEPEARSDAERHCEDKIGELDCADIDAAYTSLVGCAPIKDKGMNGDDAADLLFERMKEGE